MKKVLIYLVVIMFFLLIFIISVKGVIFASFYGNNTHASDRLHIASLGKTFDKALTDNDFFVLHSECENHQVGDIFIQEEDCVGGKRTRRVACANDLTIRPLLNGGEWSSCS